MTKTFCRVYWGSHGCHLPRGHDGGHLCDCCTCVNHPDPPSDPDEGECVGAAPYYGSETNFHGEDTCQRDCPRG